MDLKCQGPQLVLKRERDDDETPKHCPLSNAEMMRDPDDELKFPSTDLIG